MPLDPIFESQLRALRKENGEALRRSEAELQAEQARYRAEIERELHRRLREPNDDAADDERVA